MKLISKTILSAIALAALLALNPSTPASAGTTTLRPGVTNELVPRLQLFLELNSRGPFFSYGQYTEHFGPVTEAALVKWQRATHYPASGNIAVGSQQWKQLRREAVRIPPGVTKRALGHARSDGYAIDSPKGRHRLYVLHYNAQRHRVLVIRGADARYGDLRGPAYVTRNGDWTIYRKGGANYVSTMYDVLMRYPSFFSGGEAIHYSDDFAAYGYTRASHGCLNLRDLDIAKFINQHVPYGTHVVVHGHVS